MTAGVIFLIQIIYPEAWALHWLFTGAREWFRPMWSVPVTFQLDGLHSFSVDLFVAYILFSGTYTCCFGLGDSCSFPGFFLLILRLPLRAHLWTSLFRSNFSCLIPMPINHLSPTIFRVIFSAWNHFYYLSSSETLLWVRKSVFQSGIQRVPHSPINYCGCNVHSPSQTSHTWWSVWLLTSYTLPFCLMCLPFRFEVT